MSDEKTGRLCLHNYETAAQIWVDPDAIVLLQRLPASKDFPERTKLVVSGQILLVSELPDEIAAYSRWKILLPQPANEAEYAAKMADNATKRKEAKQRDLEREAEL